MSDDPRPAPPTDADAELTPVWTENSPERVADLLERLSKKGQLPGYERGGDGGLFSVDAQGTPFDRRLVGRASERDGGTVLAWRLVTPRRWPVGIALVLALTVWPGWPITDSLLQTYFPGSYGAWTSGWFRTWMWYLPVTVLPIPWFWKSTFRKVHESTLAHARETREKIREAIGGKDVG
ncbi:MAG: hypothetical protein ACIARR_08040 [Phycisphaerales bacterium JB059]